MMELITNNTKRGGSIGNRQISLENGNYAILQHRDLSLMAGNASCLTSYNDGLLSKCPWGRLTHPYVLSIVYVALEVKRG